MTAFRWFPTSRSARSRGWWPPIPGCCRPRRFGQRTMFSSPLQPLTTPIETTSVFSQTSTLRMAGNLELLCSSYSFNQQNYAFKTLLYGFFFYAPTFYSKHVKEDVLVRAFCLACTVQTKSTHLYCRSQFVGKLLKYLTLSQDLKHLCCIPENFPHLK